MRLNAKPTLAPYRLTVPRATVLRFRPFRWLPKPNQLGAAGLPIGTTGRRIEGTEGYV